MKLKINTAKDNLFEALNISDRREFYLEREFNKISDEWFEESKNELKSTLETMRKLYDKGKIKDLEDFKDQLIEQLTTSGKTILCKAELIERMGKVSETPEELVMATISAVATFKNFGRAMDAAIEAAAIEAAAISSGIKKGGKVGDALAVARDLIKKAKE